MKSRAHPATRYFFVSLASKLPSFSVKSIPKKTKTEPALKVVPAPLFIPPTQAPKPSSSHPVLDFSEASAVVMEPWKGSSGSRSSQIQDSQADPNFPSTGSDWVSPCLDVEVHKTLTSLMLHVGFSTRWNVLRPTSLSGHFYTGRRKKAALPQITQELLEFKERGDGEQNAGKSWFVHP